MKRVGPELKMPDLKSVKVPGVLRDLFEDLRDRRLLPLVGLIAIAIVATPFLLGSDSDIEEAVPSPGVPLEASTPAGADRSLTVVKAEPGLRDYHRRLRHRKAKNPFRPHHTGAVLAGTQLNGSPETSSGISVESESSSSTTVESGSGPTSESTGGAPGGGGNGNGNSGNSNSNPGNLTYYAFAIDVKITKTKTEANGKKSKPEVTEKNRVLSPGALPGEKTQVVTFMGISPKTKMPLLLVSEDVESVFGETECLAGSGHCQLIEVEPQMPVTFVYGENKVRYKIVILKVDVVPTGHPETP